jgi:hypothetical protein
MPSAALPALASLVRRKFLSFLRHQCDKAVNPKHREMAQFFLFAILMARTHQMDADSTQIL